MGLMELQTQYETTKKEQAIVLLEQEQALADAALEQARVRNLLLGALAAVLLLLVAAAVWFSMRMRKANAQLATLNRSKDKFFAIIAHDLRGAATSFQGVGTIMNTYARRNQPEKVEGMAKAMEANSTRLTNLLDNLLSWAFSQLNTVPYKPAPQEVATLVAEVVSDVELQAVAKGIALSQALEPKATVWADRDGVQLVLRNLLSNALKFTPNGGSIHIATSTTGNRTAIVVRDTGIGIAAERLPTLFELKAARASQGTEGEAGAGLGLMLVKEYITLNKGTVAVESTLGAGTTFTLLLPRKQAT